MSKGFADQSGRFTDIAAVTNNHATERWQFWLDRGGTFTDVMARR